MEQIEKIQGTEKEFIKVFQELCYSRSSWQVWADLMPASVKAFVAVFEKLMKEREEKMERKCG